MGIGREYLSSGVCQQQRCRPACTSVQSDQRNYYSLIGGAQSDQGLCYMLIGKFHILTCYKQNINVLPSLCSWGDWFEPSFVGNPKDRFCRDKAQIILVTNTAKTVVKPPGGANIGIMWHSIFVSKQLIMLGKQIYRNRVFHVIPLSHIGFTGLPTHGVIKLHGDMKCHVTAMPGS